MRVAGEKSNSALLLIAGWPDRSAKNQVTYTAHLRLSTAIKGAIILRFVLGNRVTMRIDIMTGGDKSLHHPPYYVVSSCHHLSPRPPTPPKGVIIVIILIQTPPPPLT